MEISIIGSGTMATGITQVICNSNEITKVNIVARTEAKAVNVIEVCKKGIKRLVRKSKLTEAQAIEAVEKLEACTDLEVVRNSDLIIEAVAEDFIVKMELFSKLSSLVHENAIVATNTSSLSVTAFASVLLNPKNVVGLHFFNPAPVMELVEIVVGHETSSSVVDKLESFTYMLGKSPVVVQEAPGFVVNRMLIPMINEAVSIFSEGIASAEDIDKAMKLGAHHPMGPLALADLIGNDVNLSIMETLYSETGDPKYRAHPLLRKMVRANHLGRKTKKGFFEY
ncbi:3-hydroxyacyl-CoA dehydrogenase family protein [Pseudoalteromonas sp. Angola-7]|uniref:3-hydroxyacyl-CoA dehydrogenase family protein n=1 Tax=Pseudoalteromonas sp. Angola-7 TaxID=3025336 RepID=UPI00235890C6|nr:3-hydroxyacyl-CoA dehydrogenase NAD-binding domain-containing protein [Pseudoalteromonas sp. Angola-7]MDC9529668.1 3-hydroxyacyl-CoA dehydrogenase NAD-binding domain-containing protein [Pseudoalteromonas sp. Angola-7]